MRPFEDFVRVVIDPGLASTNQMAINGTNSPFAAQPLVLVPVNAVC
jgi:hypothetical protein